MQEICQCLHLHRDADHIQRTYQLFQDILPIQKMMQWICREKLDQVRHRATYIFDKTRLVVLCGGLILY